MSGVLCDRNLSARVKDKIYKCVVRPAMLYGMEMVAAMKRQVGKMEVENSEMGTGSDKRGKIRNKYM